MPIFKTTIQRIHKSEHTFIDEYETEARAIRSAKHFAKQIDWRDIGCNHTDEFEVKRVQQTQLHNLHPLLQGDLLKLRKIRAKRRKKS